MVLLLADDLGWGDLSVSGHPTSRTPNIDRCSVEHTENTGATCHVSRLATSSVRLSSLYSASPVCSPSRAALLTGDPRHAHHS